MYEMFQADTSEKLHKCREAKTRNLFTKESKHPHLTEDLLVLLSGRPHGYV